MKLSKSRITYLLEVYSAGNATTEEEQELFGWVMEENEEPVNEHIEKLVSSYRAGDVDFPPDWEQLYRQIVKEKKLRDEAPPVVRNIWRLGWAAAAIVLMLAAGYYLIVADNGLERSELTSVKRIEPGDVAPPAAVNAVLTLANGERIIIDSTDKGMLAMQGTVKVVKLADGQIEYKGTSKGMEYNTLSNPRGSRVIGITLADGSKVWLNAASSLRYPTAFTGRERRVEITGEAYFEVTHNPAIPFVVGKDGNTVRVLGTHFNVNAYDDEHSMNVTLLEGSVSVTATGNPVSKVLQPGVQAKMGKSGNIEMLYSVDTEQVMAWKHDLFSFSGAGIEDIMRQVARWYDVEVIFDKDVTEKFYAEVSRSTNVSTLLKMLEGTKSVQFSIEGKTIRVEPYETPAVSQK